MSTKFSTLRRRSCRGSRNRRRLLFEALEGRTLLTAFNWVDTGQDDTWTDVGNWDRPNDTVDVPRGGSDPYYPSSSGLWDIALFDTGVSVSVTAVNGASAGRVEVSVPTTFDLNGSSDVHFGSPQRAFPDLLVSSAFTVENGGSASTLTAPFVRTDGTLSVSGAATTLLSNGIEVSGELIVDNGASVSVDDEIAGQTPLSAPLLIGFDDGSTATVTATDSGTQLESYGETVIGVSGAGELSVEDQAQVTLGDVHVSKGSWGAVNVTGGGQLNTSDASVGVNELEPDPIAGIPSAVVTVTGTGSEWNLTSDFMVGPRGDVTIEEDGIISAAGLVNNFGTITIGEDGILEATTVVNSGRIRNDSITANAVMRVNGDYVQTPSGHLTINGLETGGSGVTQQWYLEVDGNLELAGTLEVFITNPVGLDASDEPTNYWTVLRTTGTIEGAFDFIDIHNEPNTQRYALDVVDTGVWCELRLVAQLDLDDEAGETVDEMAQDTGFVVLDSSVVYVDGIPRLELTYQVIRTDSVAVSGTVPLVLFAANYDDDVGGALDLK